MKKGRTTNKQPLRNPRAREGELINLAINLAEGKLRDGTASSQLITHFLKLATTREELENDRLRADLKLSEAKVHHLESQATSKELYEEAIKAFRTYAGANNEEEFQDDADY